MPLRFTYSAMIATIVLLPSALSAQEPDGTTAQCLHFGDTQEVCTCATETLAGEVAEEDLALYAEIGIAALAGIASGTAMVDAYDAATAAAATARGIGTSAARSTTNTVGRAHRDAISACST